MAWRLRGSLQVGNFMHYISRFVAGFAIGFSQVWQISLVTLAIVPLIAIAGGTYAYVTIVLMARVRKSYVKAGEIAEEVNRLRFSLHSRCVLKALSFVLGEHARTHAAVGSRR